MVENRRTYTYRKNRQIAGQIYSDKSVLVIFAYAAKMHSQINLYWNCRGEERIR